MSDAPANSGKQPEPEPRAISISPEQDLDLNLGASTDSVAANIDLDVMATKAPAETKPPAELAAPAPAVSQQAPTPTPVVDTPASPKPTPPVAKQAPHQPRVPSAPAAGNRPAPKPVQATPTAPAEAPAAPVPPPSPPKPPEWKKLEPEDQSDPVDHERKEVWSGPFGWQLVAASVRGKLHEHTAKWRDDAYKFDRVDDWTIIAVSDGAGSAVLSRIGAQIACDEAVRQLKTFLQGYRVSRGEDQPPDADLQRIRLFLTNAARSAKEAIRGEADRRKRAINDFHATLLLAIVTEWQGKDLAAAIQIGDGCIGLKAANGYRVLGISDHGDYSSETRFLTTPNIELEFHNRVCFSIPSGLTAMALMTDGVADDFYPEKTRIVELFEGAPIEGLKTKAGEPLQGLLHVVAKDPRDGDALRDWLRYEKRASSDDRTLVLLHRSAQP